MKDRTQRIWTEGEQEPDGEPSEPRPRMESGPVPRPSQPQQAVAIGNAMKALFESSHVSIQRGDETRVINKSLPPPAPIPRAVTSSRPPAPTRSTPPGPRVDPWLWMVMAVGVFAIAGWMIAYAW